MLVYEQAALPRVSTLCVRCLDSLLALHRRGVSETRKRNLSHDAGFETNYLMGKHILPIDNLLLYLPNTPVLETSKLWMLLW